MILQLSYWVDSFAETTSTWLFALVRLVVMEIVSRELKSAESAPHGSLILVARQLVSVEVDERLLDTAEPTCMCSAFTAMWRCFPTLDTHFADRAIVIWQVTISWIDIDVDQLQRTAFFICRWWNHFL